VTPDISVTVDHGVQVIRLTRLDKKNALTGEMYDAMIMALDRGETADDIAAHVFLGAEGAFSAGNDVGDFVKRASMGREIFAGDPAPATRFIRKLPHVTKPMIAGVDGLAIGIGVTLLLHCDLVYATPRAMLRAPFLDLGLIQEAGSSLLAPERLGYNNAFELFILGETWGAERAQSAGLVSRVVAPQEIEQAAIGAALRLAEKPREAMLAARRLLKGNPEPVAKMIEDEGKVFGHLMTSPEAREAFQAFFEKRKPDFAAARRRVKGAK
jgi:enoyl-CoA hydratase/carnithine racemase